MEEIYLNNRSASWASEKVNLREACERLRSVAVSANCDSKTKMATIRTLMDVKLTDEQMTRLEDTCSPELLTCPNEQPVCDVSSIMRNQIVYERKPLPSGIELNTFNKLRNRTDNQEDTINSRLKIKNMSYLNEDFRKVVRVDMEPGKEIVVTIRVLVPFRYDSRPRDRSKDSCNQVIMVRGDNTLAELRDSIICMEEFGDVNGDVSENPKASVSVRLKDVYKSGMFYIDNTFYVDFRHAENIDYSEVVRKWMEEKEIPFAKEVLRMEDTRIRDTIVRFGYPYLFQHLGNCEHMIIFSDARMLHPDDFLAKEEYPFYKSLPKVRAGYCVLCGTLISKFIVVGCERLPRDPSYMCDNCLTSYLYKDGKKIGYFKAYRFYDGRAVL